MSSILNMKIDSKVKEEIQKLAAADRRTMANYIEVVLAAHVQEKKNAKVQ